MFKSVWLSAFLCTKQVHSEDLPECEAALAQLPSFVLKYITKYLAFFSHAVAQLLINITEKWLP